MAGFAVNYGGRATIAPGLKVADGGLGASPDVEQRKTLLDIPPNGRGREQVVYIKSKMTTDPRYVPTSSFGALYLQAELLIATGGIQESRQFNVPAAGIAIKVIADSLRLSVWKAESGLPADSDAQLAGYDVSAIVAHANGADVELLNGGLGFTLGPFILSYNSTVEFDVIAYTRKMRIPSHVSNMLWVTWLGQYGDETLSVRNLLSACDGEVVVPLWATKCVLNYSGQHATGVSANGIVPPPVQPVALQ